MDALEFISIWQRSNSFGEVCDRLDLDEQQVMEWYNQIDLPLKVYDDMPDCGENHLIGHISHIWPD
jgi:hypothetical protein